MKNKFVGYIIIGIGLVIGLIIYLFNRALTLIVADTCTHGIACTMWSTIDFQTNVSLILMAIIILIGLYFIFFNDGDGDVFEEENQLIELDSAKLILENLSGDEKIVYGFIVEAGLEVLQSELVGVSGFSKVKVTRILNKLEGKSLIERKRKGMSNLIKVVV